jgi:hypothetical protein
MTGSKAGKETTLMFATSEPAAAKAMKDSFETWWRAHEWSRRSDAHQLEPVARSAWDAGSHDARRVALAVRRSVLAVTAVACALFALWMWDNMHLGGNADALYAQIRLVQVAIGIALVSAAFFALSFSRRR